MIQSASRIVKELDADLIEEDGVPLESDWHRMAMNVLIESICYRLRKRQDFYAGGNMFIYYDEEARGQASVGPDFFYVTGVTKEPVRGKWVVWRENDRFPEVIIELTSKTTRRADHTTKKDLYEQVFAAPDYYCYDPDKKKLEGWHLVDGHYQPLEPNEYGRLWSEQLGLWVGAWEGECFQRVNTWLRFFDRKGHLVERGEEAERSLRTVEKRRAAKEKLRAEQEKQRADAAEKELALLRAKLAEQEKNGGRRT